MYDYERGNHVRYIESLIKSNDGKHYQDYEESIFQMKELQKRLNDHPFKICTKTQAVIDQCEGVYWGDILFALPNDISVLEIKFAANEILDALHRYDVKCDESSLYYNAPVNGIFFTHTAIRCNGPDLYKQGTRRFVVR